MYSFKKGPPESTLLESYLICKRKAKVYERDLKAYCLYGNLLIYDTSYGSYAQKMQSNK